MRKVKAKITYEVEVKVTKGEDLTENDLVNEIGSQLSISAPFSSGKAQVTLGRFNIQDVNLAEDNQPKTNETEK